MEHIIETEQRITVVEQRAKSNTHRLDDVERRQNDLDELVKTVAVLAARQQTVETDVKEIKLDVKKISSKPAQRWEAIVDKLIWAVLAAVVAFFLARIGL